jgi:hypothetical protein
MGGAPDSSLVLEGNANGWCSLFPSSPQVPIECPILNSLAKMLNANILSSFQISNRPGDFQDTIMGTGAQVQFRHCHLQELATLFIDLAVCLQKPRGYSCVAPDGGAFEPPLLNGTSGKDAVPNSSRGFAGLGTRKLLELDGGYLDMEVDAIQERTRDALAVALHLVEGAAALPFKVAEITAGTGI